LADQQHDPLWYKDAVFYELHARSFYDSDNNGKGDFAGMAMRRPALVLAMMYYRLRDML